MLLFVCLLAFVLIVLFSLFEVGLTIVQGYLIFYKFKNDLEFPILQSPCPESLGLQACSTTVS